MAGLTTLATEEEEEVREYLANVHTEYSFQCHKENADAGCQRLADFLQAVRKDFVGAARVLTWNCQQHGHYESCAKLGAYHLVGRGGVPEDPATAYSLFLGPCEKSSIDVGPHCWHNLGLLAAQGVRQPDGRPNHDLSRRFFAKACDAGVAPSCMHLAISLNTHEPRDDTRATALAENACKMGHSPSCMVAAHLLSQRGLGGKVRARELRAEAARLHAENTGRDFSVEFGK
uniref:cytochrome c oxidase assembly factor 7-like isoform X1 n=1 Tax=Myxine glutinosa TaxID=7769 RepID=UPI00358ECAFB